MNDEMLLEKWCQKTSLMQGQHKHLSCKKKNNNTKTQYLQNTVKLCTIKQDPPVHWERHREADAEASIPTTRLHSH